MVVAQTCFELNQYLLAYVDNKFSNNAKLLTGTVLQVTLEEHVAHFPDHIVIDTYGSQYQSESAFIICSDDAHWSFSFLLANFPSHTRGGRSGQLCIACTLKQLTPYSLHFVSKF